jgi:hypothetical protein
MTYIEVPIGAAKRIAEEFRKDVVVILSWQQSSNMGHVTTYGAEAHHKELAAALGDRIGRDFLNPDEKNTFADFRATDAAQWQAEREKLQEQLSLANREIDELRAAIQERAGRIAQERNDEDAKGPVL